MRPRMRQDVLVLEQLHFAESKMPLDFCFSIGCPLSLFLESCFISNITHIPII